MRGIDKHKQPKNLFSYIQLEERVPTNHLLRSIRTMVEVKNTTYQKMQITAESPLAWLYKHTDVINR